MLLTTRHGKLLGKYSGPGWNYQDIVFATGKNIKARLCLKKHGDNCHQNDWLEWNRYVIVQKNDPNPLELLEVCYSCSNSWLCTHDALVKIFDQKFFCQKVRVITPGCQKKTTKGSDYDGWVSISFLNRWPFQMCVGVYIWNILL